MDKLRENPFVPIGATATVAALVTGLYHLNTGNTRKSQLMMRARVLAQGFTVVAMLGSVYLGASRVPR
ncbi:unnamed protein product [Allacma fusca]|uniref:HIG1 domain-containing protein n=1 Tax=Allacma fusca TaxID=39272 RepID=A0A8J2J4Y6_9HEXA|nr:unnamed protein product [Allacma fusca]